MTKYFMCICEGLGGVCTDANDYTNDDANNDDAR